MGEFGVWDKEGAKNSINSGVGLGMKAHSHRQNLEAFPSKSMMMMVSSPHNHHHHHHPPLYGPSFASSACDGDGDGPTICKSLMTNYTNHFANTAATASASASSGAALVRPLQPFHILVEVTIE